MPLWHPIRRKSAEKLKEHPESAVIIGRYDERSSSGV